MKQFLKWTVIPVSSVAGGALLYRWAAAARDRLEHGLERVEGVAAEARQAPAHTEATLGRTANAARELRRTVW